MNYKKHAEEVTLYHLTYLMEKIESVSTEESQINTFLEHIKELLVELWRPNRPKGKTDKRKQHNEPKKPKITKKNTTENSLKGACWWCGTSTNDSSWYCKRCKYRWN